MSQMITRNEVEDLCEQELQSKFYGLMQDLIRSQNILNERAKALASLETVEAELNRKRAFRAPVRSTEMRVLGDRGRLARGGPYRPLFAAEGIPFALSYDYLCKSFQSSTTSAARLRSAKAATLDRLPQMFILHHRRVPFLLVS